MICLVKIPENWHPSPSVFMRISGNTAGEKVNSLKQILAGVEPGKYIVNQEMFYSIDNHPFAYRLTKTERDTCRFGTKRS